MASAPPTLFAMLVILSLLASMTAASTHPHHHIRISGTSRISPISELHSANYSKTTSNWPSGVLRIRGDSDDEPNEKDTYGPDWSQASCLFCPSADTLKRSGEDLLRELDTQTMISYARADLKELNNKCVFYTAHKDRKTNPKKKLSAGATKWACSMKRFSIWVLSFTPKLSSVLANVLQP